MVVTSFRMEGTTQMFGKSSDGAKIWDGRSEPLTMDSDRRLGKGQTAMPKEGAADQKGNGQLNTAAGRSVSRQSLSTTSRNSRYLGHRSANLRRNAL